MFGAVCACEFQFLLRGLRARSASSTGNFPSQLHPLRIASVLGFCRYSDRSKLVFRVVRACRLVLSTAAPIWRADKASRVEAKQTTLSQIWDYKSLISNKMPTHLFRKLACLSWESRLVVPQGRHHDLWRGNMRIVANALTDADALQYAGLREAMAVLEQGPVSIKGSNCSPPSHGGDCRGASRGSAGFGGMAKLRGEFRGGFRDWV